MKPQKNEQFLEKINSSMDSYKKIKSSFLKMSGHLKMTLPHNFKIKRAKIDEEFSKNYNACIIVTM